MHRSRKGFAAEVPRGKGVQATMKYSRCCLFRYEIKLYLPEKLTSGATCTLPKLERSIQSIEPLRNRVGVRESILNERCCELICSLLLMIAGNKGTYSAPEQREVSL